MSTSPPSRPSALIDFTTPRRDAARLRLAFDSPIEILVAHEPGEVAGVLNAAHARALAGCWCVGHVAFEAAAAFDPAYALHPNTPSHRPLAWFAVYAQGDPDRPWAPEPQAHPWRLSPWTSALTADAFNLRMEQIHRAIADGEVYQINLTTRMNSTFRGDPLALFNALHRAQPHSYAAYLDMGDTQLLSVSPELFFDWREGRILSRPMKGTAARGVSPEQDQAQASALRSSAKERAENLMIVDLIRNDLSRIAEPFSVHVPQLFELQAWPTIWQMTSDVEARTRAGTTLADVFGALFPCGSVTGAPKVRALHWIRQLEDHARGPYCGAIGVLQPGGAVTFNVAIRTVVLAHNQACCGIGSGITADATAPGEWLEWQNKRLFLERCQTPFELLETLRLAEGVYPQLDAHLKRMKQAAHYFAYRFDERAVRVALHNLALQHGQGPWRVRLCSDADGVYRVEASPLQTPELPIHVQLASRPMPQAQGEFVRFKTTRREHYESFAPEDPSVFDTLLWNDAGELTEFTRGNVAVLIDGQWLTPPLASGLLPGVGRELALHEGRVTESVLRREDLRRAQGLAFINALRGWLPVTLVETSPAATTPHAV